MSIASAVWWLYGELRYSSLYCTRCSNTSSTAQGRGGSSKDRNPMGEHGCCEPWMAERSKSTDGPKGGWSVGVFVCLFSYPAMYHVCLSIELFICLSVCPCVCSLSAVCLSACLSIHPSMRPFVQPSIHLSSFQYPYAYLSIDPSIHSVYLSIRLSIYLSLCLSISLPVCLSICLSTYPSLYWASFYISVYLYTCRSYSARLVWNVEVESWNICFSARLPSSLEADNIKNAAIVRETKHCWRPALLTASCKCVFFCPFSIPSV